MLPRVIYDRAVPSRNLITTISGLVVLVIQGAALFNLITAEQASGLNQYVPEILTALSGIILLFAKDPTA
jgi:hypothetical protein